jgi:two-component system CheB/CheR fusion protein
VQQVDGAPSEEATDQIVVIGASAGGIDVLISLVAALPPDFAAPIVIAQHLDPHRESHLGEIVAARTSLAVTTVEDRSKLEPGRIFILPPDTDPRIEDGQVVVHGHTGRKSSPSVDGLFSSAASVYGERTIAVILSGTGNDGTAGAGDVKTAGGTVVIQNPDTAAYPGMPRSIPPTLVDIVADADALGPLLVELATGPRPPSRPEEERLLRSFLGQVKDRSGIDFGAYKRATILRRLQRRMAATGANGLREYVRYVQAHPEEYQRLTAAFLIKVTEFFRDRDLFDLLRDRIVPRLVDDARDRGNELRLWSAGCATGEEAYSLAIVVADVLGDELGAFNVRIFATDVDADAIAFARRGIYPASEFSAMPREQVERYFSRDGDHYEVRKTIRAMTVFGQHDLGQRAPFPRLDLALCRNVLIYFTTELQKRALQLFAFSLRDGGYLVLGKAESTAPLSDYFVLEHARLKVYRREGERVLIPPARIPDTTSLLPSLGVVPPSRAWTEPPARLGRDAPKPATAGDRVESLLLRLPVGVVVVDRRYDIHSINAAARRLLAIHGPAINDDFVHLMPERAAGDVRRVLDAALRGNAGSALVQIPASTPDGAEVRAVELAAYPASPDAGLFDGDGVLVVVTDVTVAVRARRGLEGELEDERTERGRMATDSRALAASNAELVEANVDLTTTNAELRTANEELLVANEEVQAATEEVETLNEELQATNEELETLNEELQATVEELNTTNDDLEARGTELEATAAQSSAGAAAGGRRSDVLVAMLDALPEPVVALSHGEVVLSNHAFGEVFGGEREVYDERGGRIPKSRDPITLAGQGEEVRARVRPRKDGPLLEARSEAVDTTDGRIAVVIFRPLDD